MDLSTAYASHIIGQQEAYDDQILKEIWKDDTMLNLNAQESQDACEAVYESQGSDAYNKCYNAHLGCGSDNACNELAAKYAQALQKGYSKDFEAFKKKSNILYQVGEIGGGILSGLLGSLGGEDRRDQRDFQTGGTYVPPRRSRTGLYIGLGVLALAGIGAAIYFARKKAG